MMKDEHKILGGLPRKIGRSSCKDWVNKNLQERVRPHDSRGVEAGSRLTGVLGLHIWMITLLLMKKVARTLSCQTPRTQEH